MTNHITNGDCVGEPLKRLFPGDAVVCWRDSVFDFGEVPAIGPGEVVLWFEHDLYDQAQLMEVLDTLHGRPDVWLIQSSTYLGPMTEAQLHALWPGRQRLSGAEFDDAREAWAALRSPDPSALTRVLAPSLPYVRAALRRRAEEYPWVEDDLSLTERGILLTARAGFNDPGRLFEKCSALEEACWMGDTRFFEVLDGLKAGPDSLLDVENRLTARGFAVLEGRADRAPGAKWRWDRASGSVVACPAAENRWP